MGIKQLNKVINKFASDSVNEIHFKKLKGKKVAIDSSILIYRYRYGNRDSVDSHIWGFLNKTCMYLKYGILPVFVFDGKPPKAKKFILDKRLKQKFRIENKISDLRKFMNCSVDSSTPKLEKILPNKTNSQIRKLTNQPQKIQEEILKLQKQLTCVTKNHRNECKYFLKLLGIPIIEASNEAENMCVTLEKKGLVDYTFTEDSDALTFGSYNLLKSCQKPDHFTHIHSPTMLEHLKLTPKEFTDFCILCGCDYSPNIHKIGSITAYSLIQTHSTIENVLENLDTNRYYLPIDFDYEVARDIFGCCDGGYIPDILDVGDIDIVGLERFLVGEKNMSFVSYNKLVEKFKNSLNNFKYHTNHTSKKYLNDHIHNDYDKQKISLDFTLWD